MSNLKFTFKTVKPTGLYRSFYNPYHYIKLKGKQCGLIKKDEKDFLFRITFKVIKKDITEDDNPNCTWKWIKIKSTFEKLDEAKDWLNEKIDIIIKQFDLHLD